MMLSRKIFNNFIFLYVIFFSISNVLARHDLSTVLVEIKLEPNLYSEDSKLKVALAAAGQANRTRLQEMLHMTIVFVRVHQDYAEAFLKQLKTKIDEAYKPNEHTYDQSLKFVELASLGSKLAVCFENPASFNNMRQKIVDLCKQIGSQIFKVDKFVEFKDPKLGFLRYLSILSENNEPLFVVERPTEFKPHISIGDFKQIRKRIEKSYQDSFGRMHYKWVTVFEPPIKPSPIAMPQFLVMPRKMGKMEDARYFDTSKTGKISSEELQGIFATLSH